MAKNWGMDTTGGGTGGGWSSGWDSILNGSQAGSWFDAPISPLLDLSASPAPSVMGDLGSVLGNAPALRTPGVMDKLGGLFEGFAGTRNADGSGSTGWGMPVIQGASALMNGFMGMKNYGLAKKQFEFSKDMALKNLENQTKTINTQMEDRQRARVASNPGAYQSVDAYMKEKGLG